MLTLSFNFFAFPCECNEAVEKIQKLFSFGGWRKEHGRGRGAIFDQTEKNRIFFSSRSRREKREKFFSLCPRQTFGR